MDNFVPLEPFTVVDCTAYGITLSVVEDDDGEIFYIPIIDLELDGKHFTSIITKIANQCPHCAARAALEMAFYFSENYYPTITVIDEDGNTVDLEDERLNVDVLISEMFDTEIPTDRNIH